MNLDDAIVELFDAGIYQPEQIDQMLEQRGKKWLTAALYERRSKLIRHHVRDLAGRRVVMLPPRSAMPAGERRSMVDEYGELEWLPGFGYRPLRDFTADDLRVAAAYKRQLASDCLAEADRLEDLARELDAVGASTVGDLGVAA